MGYNPSLVSTGDFPLLASVGGEGFTPFVTFEKNASLETVGSFESLAEVGSLTFSENHKLAALPDLTALTTVGKDVTITNNAELTSIDGIRNLTSVGGNFTVKNNPKLPVCDVASLVDAITVADGIGGMIDYSGNDETDASCLAP